MFANTTHYFNRKERLASGVEQDILNVPDAHDSRRRRRGLRTAQRARVGPLRARPQGQRFQRRPASRSSTTTTSPSSTRALTYRLARQHAVVLAVNNLFDEFYYEKLGFPLQGASFKAFYRVGF